MDWFSFGWIHSSQALPLTPHSVYQPHAMPPSWKADLVIVSSICGVSFVCNIFLFWGSFSFMFSSPQPQHVPHNRHVPCVSLSTKLHSLRYRLLHFSVLISFLHYSVLWIIYVTTINRGFWLWGVQPMNIVDSCLQWWQANGNRKRIERRTGARICILMLNHFTDGCVQRCCIILHRSLGMKYRFVEPTVLEGHFVQ